jgi:hypothetical protein
MDDATVEVDFGPQQGELFARAHTREKRKSIVHATMGIVLRGPQECANLLGREDLLLRPYKSSAEARR